MFKNLFKVSKSERHKFCIDIIESSSPRADFHFLVIISTLIVTFGLIEDNVVLVIGGMLVTPLLSPILAIALGISVLDIKVTLRSIRIFFTAFIMACMVAFIVGYFAKVDLEGVKIISVMKPTAYTFLAAVVAGIAASYTWIKPNLNSTLPGIAITVTLIPPLTAIGLSLAGNNPEIFKNVLLVLILNIFGIILSGIMVFRVLEFHKVKKTVVAEVKEEKKKLEKEQNGK